MKELLLLILVVPIGLGVVLTQRLETFTVKAPEPQPVIVGRIVQVAQPTAVPVPTAIAQSGLFDPAAIIAAAQQWLGTPYLWGGCTKRGVDCSCYLQNVLAAFGIRAPRTTTEQIKWATPVPRDQIQPGDLLFFRDTCSNCGGNPTHVGLAIGGGNMIHAGDPVQISPALAGYYGTHYMAAGRVH